MLAAGTGNKQLVEFLIKSGADVKASDDHGLDALMLAATEGFDECVD